MKNAYYIVVMTHLQPLFFHGVRFNTHSYYVNTGARFDEAYTYESIEKAEAAIREAIEMVGSEHFFEIRKLYY